MILTALARAIAMYSRCPVIAVNSGGPLESVVDGRTGFLCPPEPAAWAVALRKVILDPKVCMQLQNAVCAQM